MGLEGEGSRLRGRVEGSKARGLEGEGSLRARGRGCVSSLEGEGSRLR
jgi:hypothetical protein